jgi:hypothetical protein
MSLGGRTLSPKGGSSLRSLRLGNRRMANGARREVSGLIPRPGRFEGLAPLLKHSKGLWLIRENLRTARAGCGPSPGNGQSCQRTVNW